MEYIRNVDTPKQDTIVRDGFVWRLCFMNGAEKGFYVRTNKKVRSKK